MGVFLDSPHAPLYTDSTKFKSWEVGIEEELYQLEIKARLGGAVDSKIGVYCRSLIVLHKCSIYGILRTYISNCVL